MNPKTSGTNETKHGKEEGRLEKIAKFIDPSGRDVSDAELSDPGANIHDDIPDDADERAVRKTPDTTRKS